MSSWKIVAATSAVVVVSAVCAGALLVWRPAIAAIEPPSAQAFDPGLIRRGHILATLGNCNTCHTVSGNAAFAGGLPVPTPFGTVVSSNISPDAETGIGRWSEAAFRRAMRDGVDRDGRHLYPTFPYDHFTNVSEDDDRALYAFLMTRRPVHEQPLQNRMAFPFNQRWLIAGWKLMFLRRTGYQSDPTKDAEWNRGAYLVEGLAHCGACHTPRNALGAEKPDASFAGSDVEGWHAYAINAQSPAPIPWTRAALVTYLRSGWDAAHGTARGPMAEVVANLSEVPAADVEAIATYMADVFGPPPDKSGRSGPAPTQSGMSETSATSPAHGAAIYAAACATCHETERPLPFGGVDLAISSAVSASEPRNLANIVLSGIRPAEGERSPIMPGFADSMTDAQVITLLSYLRGRFSKQPAWTGVEETVRDARRMQAASPGILTRSSANTDAPTLRAQP